MASDTAAKPCWNTVKLCACMTFLVAASTSALTVVCCGRATRGEEVTTSKQMRGVTYGGNNVDAATTSTMQQSCCG